MSGRVDVRHPDGCEATGGPAFGFGAAPLSGRLQHVWTRIGRILRIGRIGLRTERYDVPGTWHLAPGTWAGW